MGHDEPSFTALFRKEFVHHRQDWSRSYAHLFEALRQRGLAGRLNAIAASGAPAAREVLTCLAATSNTLAEWALKLHTANRSAVVRTAVAFIDDFFSAHLCKLEPGVPSRLYAGPRPADLALCGSKVRQSRNLLCRNFGDRRTMQVQVLTGSLSWIYRLHTRGTSELLLDRVVAERLPVELVDLVREEL